MTQRPSSRCGCQVRHQPRRTDTNWFRAKLPGVAAAGYSYRTRRDRSGRRQAMSASRATTIPVQHADRFFIGGEWVAPSSDATVDVIDSGTEEVYYTIAAAAPDDMTRAVVAARQAFDDGPWSRLTHAQRAEYIA